MRTDGDQHADEADGERRPAIGMDALAEQHHRETVRNNGAVKLMAVKSASGISVSAVNQQNMLAVPASERSACDFSVAVRKHLQAFDAPGDECRARRWKSRRARR